MMNSLNYFLKKKFHRTQSNGTKKSNHIKKTLFLSLFMIFYIYSFSQENGQDNGENRDNISPVIYLSYDEAGNQTQRFYCYNDGYCSTPLQQTTISEEETTEEEAKTMAQQNIEDSFSVYPNPTDGPLLITWKQSVKDKIQEIKIIGYHTPYVRSISFKQNNLFAEVNLSNEVSSFYIVQFYLTDGKIISKKIIKE